MPMSRLAEVVGAVWWESRAMRSLLHRAWRVRACDTRIFVGGDELRTGRTARPAPPAITPLLVSGECVCRDYLVDLLVEADQFLAGSGDGLVNPPGAVRAHLRMRGAGDWTRRRRTEMGAQARTDRIRSSARARGLPDEFHRALFEFVVAEAGSLAPLEDDAQLHRRLCELIAGEFGGSPEQYRARVARGLGVIEAVCRQGRRVPAGPGRTEEMITWWERYVEHPLGRRPRFGVESLSDPAPETNQPCGPQIACPVAEAEFEQVLDAAAGLPDPAGDSDLDTVLPAVLRAAFVAALNRTADPVAALRIATAELVRRGALPEHVAEHFVVDTSRVQEALRQLL